MKQFLQDIGLGYPGEWFVSQFRLKSNTIYSPTDILVPFNTHHAIEDSLFTLRSFFVISNVATAFVPVPVNIYVSEKWYGNFWTNDCIPALLDRPLMISESNNITFATQQSENIIAQIEIMRRL